MNAWEEVYSELIKNDMFCGRYDAKNGNEHFMNGISTVMEYIAERAGHGKKFERMFMRNVINSEKRAKAR